MARFPKLGLSGGQSTDELKFRSFKKKEDALSFIENPTVCVSSLNEVNGLYCVYYYEI
jgi:hypothetical protein